MTPRAAGPRVKGQLTGEGHCVQVHLFKVFGQDPKAEVYSFSCSTAELGKRKMFSFAATTRQHNRASGTRRRKKHGHVVAAVLSRAQLCSTVLYTVLYCAERWSDPYRAYCRISFIQKVSQRSSLLFGGEGI